MLVFKTYFRFLSLTLIVETSVPWWDEFFGNVWKWQPRQYNLESVMALEDSAQRICFPSRCYFCSSHDPTTDNVPRLKTIDCEHILALANQIFFIV